MRHLPATRLLSRLVLATCSAAAVAALEVSLCHAQDEPTALATDAPAAEPQPWQPQLAELREQLTSLHQELDELESRPTPDAVLEIKRLDEIIDLLQSLLSKPDAPSKADLDSLREFLSLQDNLVERGAQAERKRIDEKIDSNWGTIFGWMNLYVSFVITLFVILTALIGFLLRYFGREKITQWAKEIIEHVTKQARQQYEQQLRTQGEQEVTRLLQRLESRAERDIDDIKISFEKRIEIVSARYETRLLDSPETPEEKAELKDLAQQLTEIKGTSEYTIQEWFVRGLAAQENEDWEQAYRYYSAAIKKEPLYAAAYINRGSTLGQLERFDEALADHAKAIELKPDDSMAYNNRGFTLGKLERYDEALTDYTKAIEIKPDFVLAYNNRGNTLSGLERYDEALADYAKVIEIKPDDAMAYYNRGNTLGELERYDEALADFTKAIEIKPDDAAPYLNAAENRIFADKPDAALEFLDSATPDVQEAEYRALSAWLACIATALLGKDTTVAEAEFAAAMEKDFKRTADTDEIERWLEKADLDEDVRTYIREKIEQFKAH